MIECILDPFLSTWKKCVWNLFFSDHFYLICIICKYPCLLTYSLSKFYYSSRKSVFLLTFLICLCNDLNLSRSFCFLRSYLKYSINLGTYLPVCIILMGLHDKFFSDCVLNIFPNLFERRGIWEGLNGWKGSEKLYNYNLKNKRKIDLLVGFKFI